MTTPAPLEPKYPEGTPEYAAYAAELREELRKFAAGEPPYEFPTRKQLDAMFKPRRPRRR